MIKEDPWLGLIEASIQGYPVVFTHHLLRTVLQVDAKFLKTGRNSEHRRVRDCITSLGYSPIEGQSYGFNRAVTRNLGWPERSRGAWFAPGIQPTSNG